MFFLSQIQKSCMCPSFPGILETYCQIHALDWSMCLTLVPKTVFSDRVRLCEPLLSSFPSGIHHFLGMGIENKPRRIWQSYNWTRIFGVCIYNTRNVSMNTTGVFDLVPGSEAAGASSWEGIHSDRHEEFSKFSNFALQKARFTVQFLARYHVQ